MGQAWVAKAKGSQNPRAVAVSVLTRVLTEGQSLSTLLPHSFQTLPPERRALAQEFCYGTLRWVPRLELLLGKLLSKPLKPKDSDVKSLLLLGLYQLGYMDIPPHAAVSETVAVTALLKNKGWARGLVNAVLRRYLREKESLEPKLDDNAVAATAHPDWLLALLKQAWPQAWSDIVSANNQRPPMTLRVNRRRHSREDYRSQLEAQGMECDPSPYAPDALTLTQPVNVEQLPGFAQGEVSVQDSAAQLAAVLLAPGSGMRVLDACAAPGGKTGHLLEVGSGLALTAIDVEEKRLASVRQNLDRLQLDATLIAADAADPDSWWDGRPFDRILLDAPCSASGVIRRHPDIKLLRRREDIDQLVRLQAAILEALWPLLKPGGILLYATCSVLPQENSEQLANFLANHEDAKDNPIDAEWGQAVTVGRQILPGQDGMDGFFYACIEKTGSD
jgi:16S rRNA (cytosine967-C5)-methyltransferase